MRKILRAVIILLGILAVGFLSLVVIYFVQKKPSMYVTYDNADRYTAGNFTYQAQDVDAVEISWLSGAVRIVRGTGPELKVSEDVETLSDREQLRWWIDGRTLRIQYWASNYGTDKAVEKALAVEIPDSISLDVAVRKGALSLGTLDLKTLNARVTSTGDLYLDTVKAQGEMTLENSAGYAEIRSVSAADIRFESKLGEAVFGRMEATNQIEMSSTRVTLQVNSVKAKDVKIRGFSGVKLGVEACESVDIRESGSSDVSLTLGDGVGATVDFTTGSGKLNGKTVQDTARTTIGDGNCRISVDVGEGNLTVR